MNTRTPRQTESILRIADAVEDAPYALELARVVDITLAASCDPDFDTKLVRPLDPEPGNN